MNYEINLAFIILVPLKDWQTARKSKRRQMRKNDSINSVCFFKTTCDMNSIRLSHRSLTDMYAREFMVGQPTAGPVDVEVIHDWLAIKKTKRGGNRYTYSPDFAKKKAERQVIVMMIYRVTNQLKFDWLAVQCREF